MMTEWIRCFVGVALPGPARDELGELVRQGRATWPPAPVAPRVRFVPVESLHLTLQFLGRVSSASIEDLEAALHRCRTPAFRLRLGGVRQFPEAGSPRIVYASVGGDLPGLHALAEEVRRQSAAAGFVAETTGGTPAGGETGVFTTASLSTGGSANDGNGFRPHVTLARCRLPADRELPGSGMPSWPPQFQPRPISFDVRRVALFASLQQPNGSVYRVLSESRLPGRIGPGHAD